MYVLGHKCKIVLIVSVEISQCYYHIKECIVLLFSSSAFGLIFLAFKYIVVVRLFIYAYCPVYPNRKSGQKLLVFLAALFCKLGFYRIGLKVYYFLWRSTEYRIIATILIYLTCQYYFGQEEYNVFCCFAITIPDIPDILEYVSDRQIILDYVIQTVWVSFNKQQHKIYSN